MFNNEAGFPAFLFMYTTNISDGKRLRMVFSLLILFLLFRIIFVPGCNGLGQDPISTQQYPTFSSFNAGENSSATSDT